MESCDKVIPEHKKGIDSKIIFSRDTDTTVFARELFQYARLNLLGVNRWHKLSKESNVMFTMIDQYGRKVNGQPKEGFYFRIDMPGEPDSENDRETDWVIVEKIEESSTDDNDFIGIRVRPARPPFRMDGKGATAHFFNDGATSTFCITRTGTKVTAGVYGKLEKENKPAISIWAKIKNFFITVHAMRALHKPQWKKLVHGLLTPYS
jgi:hypothetical protein